MLYFFFSLYLSSESITLCKKINSALFVRGGESRHPCPDWAKEEGLVKKTEGRDFLVCFLCHASLPDIFLWPLSDTSKRERDSRTILEEVYLNNPKSKGTTPYIVLFHYLLSVWRGGGGYSSYREDTQPHPTPPHPTTVSSSRLSICFWWQYLCRLICCYHSNRNQAIPI